MRRPHLWLALAMSACAVVFAQELPTHEGETPSLEIDPPLLIQARNADGSFVLAGPAATPAPPEDIAKLEKDVARAKRNAAGADGLYKSGVISKVEAEQRALRVIQLEAKLADARLQLAKREAEQSNDDAAEAKPEPNVTVAQAEETAARAAAEKRKAEIDAAVRNLERQQKLLALGSGHKSDVTRAEQKLVELQNAQQ